MNKERFIEIMSEDLKTEKFIEYEGCNVLYGLLIINKYLPKRGIEGASHDVIYSVDVDELVEAGITEDEVVDLREMNWTRS